MRSETSIRFAPAFRRTLIAVIAFATGIAPAAAITDIDPPFAKLAGRWVGEGMLGLKASPPEKVKCRATYFVNDAKDELKQTVRCATSGGNIEVVSNVKNSGGALSGHWKETMHNYEGDLSGTITPRGMRIVVKSEQITANMDIMLTSDKQVVEIQFLNASLIGLSLIMKKG